MPPRHGRAEAAAYCVAAVVLLVLGRLVGSADMVRCHLAAAVSAAIFFSFPQVMTFFEGVIRAFDLNTAPHYFYAATLIGMPLVVLFVAKGEILLKLAVVFCVTVVTIALVEFALVRFGGEDSVRAQAPAETPAAAWAPAGAPAAAGTARPNVYHIVVVGYAAAGKLTAGLGFDNGAFLRALGERGFALPDGAMANYPKTVLATGGDHR